ncbi:Ubiquitin-related modifier 1-like protein, partial [Stegodyphus mimosarum]
MEVNVNFSGGLELLFKNKKNYRVALPSENGKWTIKSLIAHLKDNLLQER